MIYAALAAEFAGIQSPRNYNNHIGLPLSLLQIQPSDEFAVLEMGASRVGEIRELAEISAPEIGVITGIGVSHLEGFGSRERIIEAKGELLEQLPQSGFAVLPGDEDTTDQLAHRAKCPVIRVGENRDNHIRITHLESDNESVRFRIDNRQYAVSATGRHHVRAAAVAVSVAREIGMKPETIAEGLRSFRPISGRCRLEHIGPWHIIDDTYNANPRSMEAACGVLREWQGNGKRILITGDMLELGTETVGSHRELGRLAAEANIDQLIVHGDYSKHVLEGACDHGLDQFPFLMQNHNRGLFISFACVLLGVGVMMVHSASITSWPTEFEQVYLSRHLVFLLIGATAAGICSVLPSRFWYRIAPLLFTATACLLVLVLFPNIGTRVNGARRWLRAGGVSFQPSEFAKIALPLLVARILFQNRERLRGIAAGMIPVLVPPAIVVPLVIIQPDLGTALFLSGGCGISLFAGGWPLRHFALISALLIPACIALVTMRPYQLERISGFAAAWTDINQAPYQLRQSLMSLGVGGIDGVGIGKGTQKLSFLPEGNTDFVFAVVGEELGLMGTLGLCAVWLALLVSGLKLLKGLKRSSYEFIAAFTLLTQLAFQAAINVAVVTAMVPPKGISHPLISYGGSNLVASLISLGIILRSLREEIKACLIATMLCGSLVGCAGPWTVSSLERRESFFRGQRDLTSPELPNRQSRKNEPTPGAQPPVSEDNHQGLAPTAPPNKGPAIPRATTPTSIKLELDVQVDKQKQVGSAATFRLELKNVGSETVSGLAIDCNFEKPLTFPGHPDSIARRNIGTLLPGETSKMSLSLISEKPGRFCCEFTVHSGGKERLWKAVCVTYVPRKTSVRVFAPPARTTGSRAETTLLFANVGQTELTDLQISATFDSTVLKPFEFSHGARQQQSQTQKTLTWNWKSLKPGEGVPLQIEFDCLAEAARACVRVTVASKDAPEIEATACMSITRPSGNWEMRIADTLDPAKIGDETAVIVSLGNRSGRPASPERLQIDIPANFRVVTASACAVVTGQFPVNRVFRTYVNRVLLTDAQDDIHGNRLPFPQAAICSVNAGTRSGDIVDVPGQPMTTPNMSESDADSLTLSTIDCRSDDATQLLDALREKLSPRGNVVSESGRQRTIDLFGQPLTPQEVVERICDDVARDGLPAVLDYTQKLDGKQLTAETMRVSADELAAAHAAADDELLQTVRRVRDNITAFQQAVITETVSLVKHDGDAKVELRQRYSPLRRIGICVPGGAAAYPSTVLMTAVPAQAAGVEEIAVVVPPTDFGGYNTDLLAVCHELGLTEIYRVGGAQAVAALAYGVQEIERVDKIVGPGNLFVALAKKHVFGEVDIDSIAGPSEVVVLADETARADFVASDLISQAEHSPGSGVLITWHPPLIDAVKTQLSSQLARLPRGDLARQSLNDYGALILAADADDAARLSDLLAPEHLHISTADPEAMLAKVQNAGAIFLGHYTPVALGDYLAGPSHVLPTGGTARFANGLSSIDFLKRSSVIAYNQSALAAAAADVQLLADREGLTAHRASVDIRLES
eukprot:g8398.t1